MGMRARHAAAAAAAAPAAAHSASPASSSSPSLSSSPRQIQEVVVATSTTSPLTTTQPTTLHPGVGVGGGTASSSSSMRIRPPPPTRNTIRRRSRSSITHRRFLFGFIAFASIALIAIHVWLFRTLVSNSNSDDAREDATHPQRPRPRPRPQQQRQRQRRRVPTMTLSDAKSQTLTPLTTPRDRNYYTVRLNTYRRNDQLIVSVNHHASCPGVAYIVVIWCDAENDPPDEVVHHASGKVTVEYHENNSLNERFHILAPNDDGEGSGWNAAGKDGKGTGSTTTTTTTLGVLSLDDDILRPCEAYDVGFYKWVRHPDRIVGYDARSHVVVAATNDNSNNKDGKNDNPDGTWSYGYLSTTEKSNRYSLTLPRCCFVHRDYLQLYYKSIPSVIYDTVETSFNCEDIALSFFVSYMTNGRPPLLADYWAVKSMVKLYVPKSISGTKDHKRLRDGCVETFAVALGLKPKRRPLSSYPAGDDKEEEGGGGGGETPTTSLQSAKLFHPGAESMFEYGARVSDDDDEEEDKEVKEEKDDEGRQQHPRRDGFVQFNTDLKSLDQPALVKTVGLMRNRAALGALRVGLIEKTPQWKERFGGGGDDNNSNNKINDEEDQRRSGEIKRRNEWKVK